MTSTFRQLDGNAPSAARDGGSALEDWYQRVRDIPIDQLDSGDLARACRQELFLDALVPIALDRIAEDANAGGLYDGELASAVARIPNRFWTTHRELSDRAMRVLNMARPSLDEDVVAEVSAFMKSVR